jgi:hypothetical protein
MRRREPTPPAPPERRDLWRPLVVGALLLVALLLGCFPMADFDVWWHLRSGQLVLQNRGVPHVDVFTYTNAGRPWIDIYWAYQIAINVLFRVGGVSALVLWKALAGVALVGSTLWARRRGAALWPAVLFWMPGLILLSGRLNERPELFSLLYLAGFLLVLGKASERPRLLWWLPALQLLWVNSHGYFVLGPLILAAWAADLAWQRLRHREIPDGLGRTLAAVGPAVLLACFINPYGWGAFSLFFQQFAKLGAQGIYRANIGELRSIGDFISLSGMRNPYLLSFFVVLLLGLASFAWAGARRRFSLFRAVIFGGAAYLGWQATRNSAFMTVIVAVVFLANLDEASPVPGETVKKRKKPARRVEPVLLAALIVMMVALLSGRLYAWAGEGRTIGLGERPDWFAHESCEFWARPGMPERMVAFNLSQAGVCIAHTGETRKQFIDPRLEVNSTETFERYLAGLRGLWRGSDDWEAALLIDRARPEEIPALLVERGILNRVIYQLLQNPRWRCVHADSVATVFVDSAFAEAHGLAAVKI